MCKSGNAFIAAGCLLIAAALLWTVKIRSDDMQARRVSQDIVVRLSAGLNEKTADGPAKLPDPYDAAMTEKEIDGISYIGTLMLPALNITLPVISQVSDYYLTIAPCRYTGSVKTNNLTIAAHNYRSHFAYIGDLKIGDTVLFTDMDNITAQYSVAAKEVLEPTAVEDMTAGEYDLTLFTCTYGGQYRITVRCDKVL